MDSMHFGMQAWSLYFETSSSMKLTCYNYQIPSVHHVCFCVYSNEDVSVNAVLCVSYQCFLLTWLAFPHCRSKVSTCQKASSCQSEGWMKAGPCWCWPIRRFWWKVRWSAVRPTRCLCSTARLQREESACFSCIIKVSLFQNKPLMH